MCIKSHINKNKKNLFLLNIIICICIQNLSGIDIFSRFFLNNFTVFYNVFYFHKKKIYKVIMKCKQMIYR